MISPRLDPEQAHVARIVAEARRLAFDRGRVTRAVRRLESVGEGRDDLLTRAAGTILHNVLVDPRTGEDLVAVGLLVLAGADPVEVRDRALPSQGSSRKST